MKQEEFKQYILDLSLAQQLKTEILLELVSVIRKYINENGTQNMFDKTDSDLKTAIKQRLREKLPREQLSKEQIEQISDNVSDLLQLYLFNNDGLIDIYLEPSQNVLKKLGNFFDFLKNLDENKLGLGEVV